MAAVAPADSTPDIIGFSNGKITWTNVNPALYYTVEWLPTLTGTNTWTNSFRGLQDLQSASPTITANVPIFLRIVGRTNAVQTKTLSPATTNMEAGYYQATNLTAVDPNLARGNIRSGVSIFGVSGKTEVVDTSSGNAAEGDILLSKSAWVGGQQIDGIMPTRTLSAAYDTVLAGYYSMTTLNAVDGDLQPANIRAGVNIFGFTGDANVVNTSAGTAVAGDMLLGKKAYVAGAAITGTVPAGTNIMGTNGALVITITNGLYAGNKTVTANDTNLVTGNIRAGIKVFGITGSNAVVDTTIGDAAASEIFPGKVAFVGGLALTGTLSTITLSDTTTVVASGYYAATNLAMVDTDLVKANIKAGIAIFGVVGSNTVVDTVSGTAALVSDVRTGKQAFVNGTVVNGTLPTLTISSATSVVLAGYYAVTNLMQVDTNFAAGNIKAGISIFGVAGSNTVVDTTSGTAALVSDVRTGKQAFVNGTVLNGNLPALTFSSATAVVKAGYYAATNLMQVDANLTAKNIAANVTLFGIAGTLSTTPSAVPKTGQTTSYTTADDGSLMNGVSWPNPRFTPGVGTYSNCVTDNLTGLMWLKNPDALARSWSNAISYCIALDGTAGRGNYSDWRLPNWNELRSLLDASTYSPALPTGHPFLGIQPNHYWSSTTYAHTPDLAWIVGLDVGYINGTSKANVYYVWPVRGGQ